MKNLSEVLSNYSDYQTFMDDRFGVRLCQFLTEAEAEKLGFSLSEEAKASGKTWASPKEWTKENILSQLKSDVEFGWEKACDERGISSNLMYEVVKAWCKVLENKYADFDDYAPYGKPLFRAVANLCGWELVYG